MSEPTPVGTYVQAFRRMGREAFLRDHPAPVLLVPSVKEEVGESWTGFNTDPIPVGVVKAVGVPTAEEVDAIDKAKGLQVVAVGKSAESPWRGRISLGRARNNDMTIHAATISKLHAHFTIEDDGSVRITDAGSQNGTEINGKTLAAGSSATLSAGDTLRLGSVALVFHTAESFCDFLDGLFT
jgi:pSer/pThr/pTyr-binding forkhead associated (FHA) protein